MFPMLLKSQAAFLGRVHRTKVSRVTLKYSSVPSGLLIHTPSSENAPKHFDFFFFLPGWVFKRRVFFSLSHQLYLSFCPKSMFFMYFFLNFCFSTNDCTCWASPAGSRVPILFLLAVISMLLELCHTVKGAGAYSAEFINLFASPTASWCVWKSLATQDPEGWGEMEWGGGGG